MHVRRAELVLAAAVGICLPMAPGIINGNVDAVTAGTRFFIAIVLCWIGGSVITWVIDHYTAEALRAKAVKMLSASRRERPGPQGT